jgi:gamma-glutamylcyclotransferase (GGCT)/AIG2-like uncharacterized protein YtfP
MDTIYLFVYGTLKRGEPGHELMQGATFVSVVLKTNLRWIRDAEYPSCIETNDTTDFVVGEIWAVPAADLPLLDEYEGDNYRRVQLKDSNLYAYVLKEDTTEKFAAIT